MLDVRLQPQNIAAGSICITDEKVSNSTHLKFRNIRSHSCIGATSILVHEYSFNPEDQSKYNLMYKY